MEQTAPAYTPPASRFATVLEQIGNFCCPTRACLEKYTPEEKQLASTHLANLIPFAVIMFSSLAESKENKSIASGCSWANPVLFLCGIVAQWPTESYYPDTGLNRQIYATAAIHMALGGAEVIAGAVTENSALVNGGIANLILGGVGMGTRLFVQQYLGASEGKKQPLDPDNLYLLLKTRIFYGQ